MALPAPPIDPPMAGAGPSGARAGVPVPPGPSPHRARFGRQAAIEIDSDPEDDYDMDDLMFLPPRRNVNFAHEVDDDDDDDDVQIAGFAPVAGPAPKDPQQANRAGARAGPAPVAAATNPFEDAVQAIVGILPDISRSHLKTQLLHQPAYGPADIEAILEGFLSMPNGYPKEADDVAKGAAAGGSGKGKGRADEHEQARSGEGFMQVENTIDEDDEIERTAQTWLDIPKRGANWDATYWEAAVDQLSHDFLLIRLPDVRKYFSNSSRLYAPTYIALTALMQQPVEQRGIKMLASARSNKGKGRQKQDDNFDREREWVVNGLPKWKALQRRREAQEKRLAEEIKAGAFFECGCCFGETAMSQLVTCSEGCQFCPDCVRGIADNEIGLRKYILKCMATDGCDATFPESELVKCLPRKTLGALHKIKQEKEVDEAEIEGLVKCPFCPFAMIIENPDERLFHCHRPDCRIVSCRECGKRDHLPKTCAEVTDSELKLKSVHHVEEAMTEALIRRCPKPGCNEPYVKESGTCNKIRCSNCHTLSCYICNKIIEGYQHFKNPGSNLPLGQKVDAKATCALWDDTDSRNFQEVEAARIAAEEEARRLNAELELKEDNFAKLKMAKPAAPDPKVAHLPPPQVAAYAALAANRAVAAAGPANPGRGRAVAPPPAPAKPHARKQAAAKAAADARVQARLDADAARRRQREEARRRAQEELDRLRADAAKMRAELDRKRVQLRAEAAANAAAEARAAMDARAQLAAKQRMEAARHRYVGAQVGPSGARSPAVNQRDVLNPLPAPGGAQAAAKLDSGGSRKRMNDAEAAREAKRARLSGARPAA